MSHFCFSISDLEHKANEIRQDIVRMLSEARSGHSAGCLGFADVFTALYFHVLNHDPKKPNDPKRDRLFLSHGHIAPVWYATLAHAGYLSRKELLTLRKLGSRLQGHPDRKSLPPIENPAGPLGQGLSQATGYAYMAKQEKANFRIFCLTSDGEIQEGQAWEAFMFAAKNKLSNLTFILDRNYIQIDGNTEDVMPLESLRAKFEAFNFHVLEIDGHNMQAIIDACNEAKTIEDRPTMILARTIPGKGVSYMEGQSGWHGKPPAPGEELNLALAELRAAAEKICP